MRSLKVFGFVVAVLIAAALTGCQPATINQELDPFAFVSPTATTEKELISVVWEGPLSITSAKRIVPKAGALTCTGQAQVKIIEKVYINKTTRKRVVKPAYYLSFIKSDPNCE